jgi:hypothetical protein
MHGKIVRQKTETMIAPDASPIVEMHDLIAVVACEKLHRLCPAGLADQKCLPRDSAAGIAHEIGD